MKLPNAKLQSIEWNFDAVPDAELLPCCFWEYARESSAIRKLHQRSLQRRWAGQSAFVNDPILIGLRGIHLQRLGLPSCAVFRNHFFAKRHFPRPWQALSAATRTRLAQAELSGKRAAFERGDAVSVFQLAHRFDGKSKTWVPNPRASHGSDYGLELTAVEIDWPAFSNEQIIRSFRKWVKANRPKNVPKPQRRGRDKLLSYRVDLERLGILRLLKQVSPPELRETNPIAWQRYHTPTRRWQRDVKKAKRRFHELFPFLPADEHPLSAG